MGKDTDDRLDILQRYHKEILSGRHDKQAQTPPPPKKEPSPRIIDPRPPKPPTNPRPNPIGITPPPNEERSRSFWGWLFAGLLAGMLLMYFGIKGLTAPSFPPELSAKFSTIATELSTAVKTMDELNKKLLRYDIQKPKARVIEKVPKGYISLKEHRKRVRKRLEDAHTELERLKLVKMYELNKINMDKFWSTPMAPNETRELCITMDTNEVECWKRPLKIVKH